MAITKQNTSDLAPVVFETDTTNTTDFLSPGVETQTKVDLGANTSTAHATMTSSVITINTTGIYSLEGIVNIRGAGTPGAGNTVTVGIWTYIFVQVNNTILASPDADPKTTTIISQSTSDIFYRTIPLNAYRMSLTAGDTMQITAWYRNAGNGSTLSQLGTFATPYGTVTGSATIPTAGFSAYLKMFSYD